VKSRRGAYGQGVIEAVNLIKGKWTIAILMALALEERQNKDILTAINSSDLDNGSDESNVLSRRVLTDALHRVTEDGLIARRADDGKFGAVWYRLTPKGRALLRAIRPLADWAEEFVEPG
jgi:DNA-binding HxlR family transcriptional regulator